MKYTFSNSQDAKKFVRSHGGPVSIEVEHPSRGVWIVTIN